MRIALVFDRQVLAGAPHFPVVDADDENRRDSPLADQPVHGLGDTPGVAGERTGRVEEVLPVVEIEDGWRFLRCVGAAMNAGA